MQQGFQRFPVLIGMRNKYSKETNKLISSAVEATSKYRTRTHVVVAIGDPNAPTTNPPSDTPADSGSGSVTEDGGTTG